MTSAVYVGMAVTSHDVTALCSAVVDNVSVAGGVSQPPAPSTSTLISQALSTATTLANAQGSTEAQILPLVNAIGQAQVAFDAERASYASADQIEMNLRIAFYFARGAAALAAAGAPSSAVQARLQISAARLQQAQSLMQSASAPSGTSAVSLMTSSVIGTVEARSRASFGPTLAPSGMGTIYGTDGQTPLASSEATAAPSKNGALPFELTGASVTVGGVAASLVYVSTTRIDFAVPAGIAPGEVEVIVTSQEGYVSRGTMTVAAVAPGLFTVGGTGAGAAVALNAATYAGGSFSLVTPESLSADKRTRVMLFATGIRNASNADASNDVLRGGAVFANLAESVAVEARLRDGRVVRLPVEYAGTHGPFAGVDQLTVVLTDELRGAGAVELTVIAGGRASNAATLTVQ
jgi:uncharacterized protein (TIGR03437 family)